MSFIKYLVFLVLLFILGLAMLGLFNPHLEFEVEEEIIASVPNTWDAYRDTSRWHLWMTEGGGFIWQEGQGLREGARYSVGRVDGESVTQHVEKVITDSLIVIHNRFDSGIEKWDSIFFFVKNGKTQIVEKQIWNSGTFLENIKINFNRSNEEKAAKSRLESFRKMMEAPFLERERQMDL